MTRRLLAVALLLALQLSWLQLSGLQPANAITGGQADANHPSVVAVMYPGSGQPTCTGVWTAIGNNRRVVVTAAHCVPGARGAWMHVFFGTSSRSAHTITGRSYRHPSYDAHTHRNDVAVIQLTSDPKVSPSTLASPGSAQRSDVIAVGYGSPHSGQRWKASEKVASWSSWRLYLRPSSGNSCGGDSGGPDFIPGTYRVVALTDDGTCSWDEDTRLDQGSAREFVLGPH